MRLLPIKKAVKRTIVYQDANDDKKLKKVVQKVVFQGIGKIDLLSGRLLVVKWNRDHGFFINEKFLIGNDWKQVSIGLQNCHPLVGNSVISGSLVMPQDEDQFVYLSFGKQKINRQARIEFIDITIPSYPLILSEIIQFGFVHDALNFSNFQLILNSYLNSKNYKFVGSDGEGISGNPRSGFSFTPFSSQEEQAVYKIYLRRIVKAKLQKTGASLLQIFDLNKKSLLEEKTLVGMSNNEIESFICKKISEYQRIGYKLAKNSLRLEASKTNENYVINFVHDVKPINISQLDYGYTLNDLIKVVKTHISFVDETGRRIKKDLNRQHTFNRSGYYDLVDQEAHLKWEHEEAIYDHIPALDLRAYDVKEIQGIADSSLTINLETGEVGEQRITPFSADSELKLVFTKITRSSSRFRSLMPKLFKKR